LFRISGQAENQKLKSLLDSGLSGLGNTKPRGRIIMEDNLFAPVTINKLTLKNRIYFIF